MRWPSAAVSVALVSFVACSFDWDGFDPRLGTGGSAGVGAGSASSSVSSSGSGAGGGSACAALTADCDGIASNGCEADLTSNATCGSCSVACSTSSCATSLSESFASPPTTWTFNGTAVHDATAMSAVLTEALASSGGTVFYNRPIVTDSFVASFEAQISDSVSGAGGGTTLASPGDGMALALQLDGATALGGNGGGLGLAGLVGFGFELDTYQNDECPEPPVPHLGVSDLTACANDPVTTLTASDVLSTALAETGWHQIHVTLDNGVVSMSYDGGEVITGYALPGFVAGTSYYYGFGAGTGGSVNRHEVRNLTVTFPTPRCL